MRIGTSSSKNQGRATARGAKLRIGAIGLAVMVLVALSVPASAQGDSKVELDLPDPVSSAGPVSDLTQGPSSVQAFAGGGVDGYTVTETQSAANTYQILDSFDPNGPVPEPTDNCQSGAFVPLFAVGGQDDTEVTVDLPFPVEFYGDVHETIRVGVNGGFLFGDEGNVVSGNQYLGRAEAAVYPYWDDLEFDQAGTSHTNVFRCLGGVAPNREFDIAWYGADCYSGCNGHSPGFERIFFKVKLFESSSAIEFHYEDTTFSAGHPANYGASATVGLQSAQSEFVQFSVNQEILGDTGPFAIRFFVPTCWDFRDEVERPATHVATRLGGTVSGTAGSDVIVGHYADDFLRGFGGNDVFCARGGDDIVKAHAGDDVVDAGEGADEIYGGGGADLLYGWHGDDSIDGQGGRDIILGEDGADQLNGQGAADELRGGHGDDTLRGNAGADDLFGGQGSDTLAGEDGDDTLTGGEGNDTLYGGLGLDRCAGNTGPGDRAEAASCEASPGVEILF